jgi:catechol 2,3-dioxygenase-like lactoylglutathione lyase family enzyme
MVHQTISHKSKVAEGDMTQFPGDGVELTILLVVTDIERSRRFYRDVLGATAFREYGGTSCVLNFQGSWILLVTGGEPTRDKPDVTFAPPPDPNMVSHELTIRVPDCQAAYEILKSRGAEFLTPPVDWGGEVRCFFRDPDGHLLEISQAL